MTQDSIDGLNDFLSAHELVSVPIVFAPGSVVDGWEVVGFLGSGGTSEVYRVRRLDGDSGSPEFAALKILLRDDAPSLTRFAQEEELLRTRTCRFLPRFYAAGHWECRPYLVTELLEPVDLPTDDAGVAEYLLAVCRAVDALHREGLVHRDLKPSNIMRRADGELVLIDLGLVKDRVRSSDPERDVSIVSGKLVAVGTPRYAAPEQLSGGKVTAAADIHAIGRLADVAFGSHPPRAWLPIIRRATSSIPEHRYTSADDLARAIRRRHFARHWGIAAGIAAAALVGAALVLNRSGVLPPQLDEENAAWAAICSNGTTNLVELQLVSENDGQRIFRKVPRTVDSTVVQLNNRTNSFTRPLVLAADREYFIKGPGILTGELRSAGTNTVVHLSRCFVVNRTTLPPEKAGIRYVFDRGAYLNFPLLDEPDRETFRARFENYDARFNDVRFGGPETPRGLRNRQHEEQLDQLQRAFTTFFREFSFSVSHFVRDREVCIRRIVGSVSNTPSHLASGAMVL